MGRDHSGVRLIMADSIQLTISDDDWTELTGAGAAGSIWHQGGEGVADSNVALVEAAVKPTIDINDTFRFKSNAVGVVLAAGHLEQYYGSAKMFAISVAGDQLITVTPK